MAVVTRWLAGAVLLLATNQVSAAEAPRVVATINPLHSLTAAVMEGVGTPSLLLSGAASPHSYSLRPSEAAALQNADLIVWIGPALERFLEESLGALAPGARQVEVQELPGLLLREPREGGDWESHDHEHEKHAETEHGHGAHDHGAIDPHVWLDPGNAERLVLGVADALSQIDPGHAALYQANADKTVARLEGLETDLKGRLAPVADKPFIVFHDAYGYFEQAFGLNAVGSVTVSPEQAPSARRVAELQDKIEGLGAVCLFREPQFAPRLVDTLAEETGARVGVLDPLGAELTPGPDAYPRLLENLADSLVLCLQGTN